MARARTSCGTAATIVASSSSSFFFGITAAGAVGGIAIAGGGANAAGPSGARIGITAVGLVSGCWSGWKPGRLIGGGGLLTMFGFDPGPCRFGGIGAVFAGIGSGFGPEPGDDG